MEFRTPIHLSPPSFRINHQTNVLTLGSCFSNVIGQKLESYKFPTKTNPLGTIFNPISIFETLLASVFNKYDFFQNAYIQRDQIWYNYQFHSSFSAHSQDDLHTLLLHTVKDVHFYLQNAGIITITLGSAFVHRLVETGNIVANCHKTPSAHFHKELLDLYAIVDGFEKVYKEIKKINPSIRFIFTVSPVRHIKDGIEQNAVSKSLLRTACHLIQAKYSDVEYFPSFEIMMDDLRDYRFYKEDMIHPSEVAENYIWEKFTSKYMTADSLGFIREWEKIKKAIAHKPFHPDSHVYKHFLQETIHNLTKLSSITNVDEERHILQNRLHS